jgi:hypothetical protein
VSAIAAALHTNRPKVERCISKALQLGLRAALKDLPGRGRPVSITDEDKAWVCRSGLPKAKGSGICPGVVDHSLAGQTSPEALCGGGAPSISKLVRGTVSKILAAHPVRPHKIQCYLGVARCGLRSQDDPSTECPQGCRGVTAGRLARRGGRRAELRRKTGDPSDRQHGAGLASGTGTSGMSVLSRNGANSVVLEWPDFRTHRRSGSQRPGVKTERSQIGKTDS